MTNIHIRVSLFLQYLSAVVFLLTPLVVYLIHPETPMLGYVYLTIWPLILFVLAAFIHAKFEPIQVIS